MKLRDNIESERTKILKLLCIYIIIIIIWLLLLLLFIFMKPKSPPLKQTTRPMEPFRLDAELMNSTVWSWDAERPEATFSQARAAIASAETGRWTDVDSFWDYGERHSYACRNEGENK